MAHGDSASRAAGRGAAVPPVSRVERLALALSAGLAGLAAVWVAILTLNLAAGWKPFRGMAREPSGRVELNWLALQEQQRRLAQLLNPPARRSRRPSRAELDWPTLRPRRLNPAMISGQTPRHFGKLLRCQSLADVPSAK